MQTPQNLKVWNRALDLATETYRVTAEFPSAERFGLSFHMRKTAISIGSNIAEGCGRRGDREFLAFLHIALGSASELEFQLAVAKSLLFADGTDLDGLGNRLMDVRRMLFRLIVAIRVRTTT